MTKLTDDTARERFQAFVGGLADALVAGPFAEIIQDLAAGRRILRIVQHPDKSGWVLSTERVEPPLDSSRIG